MCGIVGLFLKKPELKPSLGALLSQMLVTMTDRGPDSAGVAVYGDGAAGRTKVTLRYGKAADFDPVAAALKKQFGEAVGIVRRDTHIVLSIPAAQEESVIALVRMLSPDVTVVGRGTRMELYKEVGKPADVALRFDLSGMSGTHGIGHTRMATESAVTTDGAHPFSTGPDQCLVHNGSLSNHNAVRRQLQRDGVSIKTENDTEVAAGYITWRLSQGHDLQAALNLALSDLDGFYTFVVGTETGFAVLRDPIACKPAVMVETDSYVAFGTEYRALVDLPDVKSGRVFEPEPAKVYFWGRPQ